MLIARAQVRPEQHTLISVFKLNSCKLCQFKHLRARGCELARVVRRFVHAFIRSAQSRASEPVLPDWVLLNLIVRVNIGLGGGTKFGLVFGQFGGFQNI